MLGWSGEIAVAIYETLRNLYIGFLSIWDPIKQKCPQLYWQSCSEKSFLYNLIRFSHLKSIFVFNVEWYICHLV